jgi:hypothetical protein
MKTQCPTCGADLDATGTSLPHFRADVWTPEACPEPCRPEPKRWESVTGTSRIITADDPIYPEWREGDREVRLTGMTMSGQKVGIVRIIEAREFFLYGDVFRWFLNRMVRDLDKMLARAGETMQ